MPDDLSKYESQHLKNIVRAVKKIKALYGLAIERISITADAIVYKGHTFQLKDYPLLKSRINEEIKSLHKGIVIEITDSIKTGWALSNEKNDKLVDRRLGGKKPKPKARTILYDPNKSALDSFIKRKEKGLNLSERVWNTLSPMPSMLEQSIAVGISEGRSAAEMARDIKNYLVEPDRLYRRVRDAEGTLQLSKKAREYKPGQGVYRSSIKNAARLTRTETNLSYQNADFERWQNLSFIKGIEVKLSRQHPFYDQCDSLAGIYPKDFRFNAWHPNCLCHAEPLLISDSDYDKLEDSILGLSDTPPDIRQIETLPKSAIDWMKQNSERVNGWKSKPYFLKNNPEYLNKYFEK